MKVACFFRPPCPPPQTKKKRGIKYSNEGTYNTYILSDYMWTCHFSINFFPKPLQKACIWLQRRYHRVGIWGSARAGLWSEMQPSPKKTINADVLAMPWPICLPRVYIPPNFQPKSSGSIFFLPPRSLGAKLRSSAFIDLPRQDMTVHRKSVGPSIVTIGVPWCPSPLHVTFWSHPILTVQDFHQWDEKACIAIHRCLLTALQMIRPTHASNCN